MNDVVIRKSKLELEIEASRKAQMEEKENRLKQINHKGIVIKVDLNTPHSNRSSKSPRFQPVKTFQAKHEPQRSSVGPSKKTEQLQ